MARAANTKFRTTQEISNDLCVSIHRVRYAIDQLQLAPTAVAGHVHLFDAAAVDCIRQLTDRIERERRKRRRKPVMAN